VKERGICMTPANVVAIRERRKTETRRIFKRKPDDNSVVYHVDGDGNWIGWYPDRPGLAEFTLKPYPKDSGKGIKCPWGVPGDLLYIKETWARVLQQDGCLHDDEPDFKCPCPGCIIEYKADTGNKYPGYWPDDCGDDPSCGHWKSGRFMPKYAARTWLEITDVRVQQVQSISEEDAIAEGIMGPFNVGYKAYRIPGDTKPRYSCATAAFAALWDSIHGPGAFERNDWCWVLSFKLIEKEAAK